RMRRESLAENQAAVAQVARTSTPSPALKAQTRERRSHLCQSRFRFAGFRQTSQSFQVSFPEQDSIDDHKSRSARSDAEPTPAFRHAFPNNYSVERWASVDFSPARARLPR